MFLVENRELLDGYRAGDSRALETIYHHYAPDIEELLRRGFGFRSGEQRLRFVGYRSEFELQEAVQETFIRAFSESARDNYDGLKPFGGYLTGIARNLVIDAFRKKQRELELFVPEGRRGRTLDAADPGELETAPVGDWTRQRVSPEREVMRSQLRRLLAEFLDGQDALTRDVIARHYGDGLSQQETADALGLDRNDVRKILRQLRLSLLRFMKSRGQISALDPAEAIGMLALLTTPPFAKR